MKKPIIPVCAICLTLLLSACANGGGGASSGGGAPTGSTPPATSAIPLPPATDQLSVYVGDPYSDTYLSIVNRKFQSQFPDVKLTLTAITPEDTTEASKLPAELAAGRGPDLVVAWNHEFSDVYKTMDTGVFCDLNAFLQNDPDFHPEDYVANVLDAGLYHGKRYFLPLTYQRPMLLTTKEALAAAGVSEASLGTFSGVLAAAEQFDSQNPDGHAFSKQQLGMSLCFPWAGVLPLDYETKQASVDTPEFQSVMESYQKIYPQDWGNVPESNYSYSQTGDEVLALEAGTQLFIGPTNSPFSLCGNFQLLGARNTPVVLPLPTQKGDSWAGVEMYAGITSASKNQKNAYEFLKLMLSPSVQSSISNLYFPVKQSAVGSQLQKFSTNGGTIGGTNLTYQSMSETDLASITALATKVDKAVFISYAPLDLVFKNMEPYFRGEAGMDTSLQNLKNDLTIYISE